MINKSNTNIYNFLLFEIGLDSNAINLGIKIANKDKTSLPIALWSYGILSTKDLHELYKYIYKN